ncbi:MAG: heme exporter protein CcmB [SAR202 cluster bacterium]|nr:heme exporter protein CcmB [SAR202 cluster bacterium]
MKNWFRAAMAIFWKDILLETRTKDMLLAILIFSILVIVIFNFAISPTPKMIGFVAPGILWVAFILGGMFGLTRSFGLEREGGALKGLLLAPVGRDAIFYGKMAAMFTLMMVVEVIVFPVFAVLFNLSLWIPWLIPVAALTTLGIATIGTVFSAIAMNTRAREIMFPLLFLPVAIPTIIAAVETSGVAIRGVELAEMSRWIPFMGAIDAVFLVICPVAFNLIIED